MLGKRSRPAIGKLQNPLIPGDRFAISDVVTSPKSPLDFVIRSPRGIKGGEVGGVGLGIVAALDKAAGGCGSEIQAKVLMGSFSLNRSSPIPVGPAKNSTKFGSEKGPNFNFTRVHCNGDEYGSGGHDRTSSDRSCMNWGVFCESQPRVSRAVRALPGLDFLNSCHSCRKKLHGKDIYMYRGEKAFCSNECRYRQIVMDERKEMCGSEASRSAEMAGSPYSGGQLFSTGIIAA